MKSETGPLLHWSKCPLHLHPLAQIWCDECGHKCGTQSKKIAAIHTANAIRWYGTTVKVWDEKWYGITYREWLAKHGLDPVLWGAVESGEMLE